MENLEIYGLLLFAIFAGWLLGRMGTGSSGDARKETGGIFHDYFVGLNYLLNDEPDEAIDTFIKALEINTTVRVLDLGNPHVKCPAGLDCMIASRPKMTAVQHLKISSCTNQNDASL